MHALRLLTFILLSTGLTLGCTEDSGGGGGGGGGGNPGPTVVLPPGCGNAELNGFEVCDGALFANGTDCSAYGLGSGTVTCSRDCALNWSACSQPDLCQALGLYSDAACSDCEALGGTPDTECAALCADDGICADAYDEFAGSWSCQAATGSVDPNCGTCGNGVVDGNELCDGSAFVAGSESCADWGFVTGSLGCTDDCIPDFEACADHLCGNYLLEAAEECDGPNWPDTDCGRLGFADGELGCRADCTFDTSRCETPSTVSLAPIDTALCAWIERCVGTFGRAFSNATECVALLTAERACDPAGAGFTATDVTTCASAFSGAPCDFTVVEGQPPGAACQRVFDGGPVSTAGQGCYDASCAEGLYCSWGGQECPVCMAEATLGQQCDFPGGSWVGCASALYCDVSGSGLCAAVKPAGSSCSEDPECASDYCAGTTCAALLPPGSACGSGDICDGMFRACIGGLCGDRRPVGSSCAGENDCVLSARCSQGSCVAVNVSVGCAGPGGAGDVGEPCDFGCLPELWCDWNTWTCQTVTPIGQPCTDYDECGFQARCDSGSGTCVGVVAVGGSCATGQTCVDGSYCDYASTLCTARKPAGAACNSLQECISWDCDSASSTCVAEQVCSP